MVYALQHLTTVPFGITGRSHRLTLSSCAKAKRKPKKHLKKSNGFRKTD